MPHSELTSSFSLFHQNRSRERSFKFYFLFFWRYEFVVIIKQLSPIECQFKSVGPNKCWFDSPNKHRNQNKINCKKKRAEKKIINFYKFSILFNFFIFRVQASYWLPKFRFNINIRELIVFVIFLSVLDLDSNTEGNTKKKKKKTSALFHTLFFFFFFGRYAQFSRSFLVLLSLLVYLCLYFLIVNIFFLCYCFALCLFFFFTLNKSHWFLNWLNQKKRSSGSKGRSNKLINIICFFLYENLNLCGFCFKFHLTIDLIFTHQTISIILSIFAVISCF